jgi:hypothetical protein
MGSTLAPELGSSACVLESAGAPLLLIDCGPDTIGWFMQAHGSHLASGFLMHSDFDHIGRWEGLFSRFMTHDDPVPRPHLFVPAGLLPGL